MSDESLLAVRNLTKHYPITEGLLRRQVGTVRAVDGIDFDIKRGETFGLVGESGCGKSTTALCLLQLEEQTDGEIRFEGESISDFSSSELRDYRRRVQYIMQNPESAFNPRITVGEAVEEPLRIHGMSDGDRRRAIVEDALERIGLSAEDADSYPHEFSGGEKQRISLARALVLNPDLIVADEPTSSLDGRTKADVLRLISDLQDEFDVSVLLISHDIDLVQRFCDRVAVMYLGEIVERGPMEEVINRPLHPYTRALMSSIPSLEPGTSAVNSSSITLSDELPDASDTPTGCRFHPRCAAIIEPEEVDLNQKEWHGVTKLRLALAEEWSSADEYVESMLRSGETIGARVRLTYELPQSLQDEAVETALVGAVEALEADNLTGARQRLDDVLRSVCESQEPVLSENHTTHPVSCHRYDPELPGEPLVE